MNLSFPNLRDFDALETQNPPFFAICLFLQLYGSVFRDLLHLSRWFLASQFYFYLQIFHKSQPNNTSFSFHLIICPQGRMPKINFKMTNRQKNNFNEQIKRFGYGQLQKQLRDRNQGKKMHFTSMGELPKEGQEEVESGKTEEMLDVMKKELDMLMVKLEEAEKERRKMAEETAILANKIGEKDKEFAQLTRELQQSQNSVLLYKRKLEEAESQLQNMRLRQKMETISKEITQEITLEKQSTTSVKHLKHQKGTFSKAALPPAFGSPKKIQFQRTNSVKEQEMGGMQNLLRNPLSGYLIDQWQRTQNERNNKGLEIANLESKIVGLKKEIGKQSKEIEQLKAQKPTRQELVSAMERVRQFERKERTLVVKLKESEKKKEMSCLLKEKGESMEEDKFYGVSTITDINNLIQKSAEILEIECNVLQLVVNSVVKSNAWTQTQDSEQLQCSNCESLRQENCISKQEITRLNKSIQATINESHHFKHCYQEILTSYRQLENDSQREINKLRAQYLQKEKSLLMAEADLEQVTDEMERYKSEFSEIEARLRKESLILRESFDC